MQMDLVREQGEEKPIATKNRLKKRRQTEMEQHITSGDYGERASK